MARCCAWRRQWRLFELLAVAAVASQGEPHQPLRSGCSIKWLPALWADVELDRADGRGYHQDCYRGSCYSCCCLCSLLGIGDCALGLDQRHPAHRSGHTPKRDWPGRGPGSVQIAAQAAHPKEQRGGTAGVGRHLRCDSTPRGPQLWAQRIKQAIRERESVCVCVYVCVSVCVCVCECECACVCV